MITEQMFYVKLIDGRKMVLKYGIDEKPVDNKPQKRG